MKNENYKNDLGAKTPAEVYGSIDKWFEETLEATNNNYYYYWSCFIATIKDPTFTPDDTENESFINNEIPESVFKLIHLTKSLCEYIAYSFEQVSSFRFPTGYSDDIAELTFNKSAASFLTSDDPLAIKIKESVYANKCNFTYEELNYLVTIMYDLIESSMRMRKMALLKLTSYKILSKSFNYAYRNSDAYNGYKTYNKYYRRLNSAGIHRPNLVLKIMNYLKINHSGCVVSRINPFIIDAKMYLNSVMYCISSDESEGKYGAVFNIIKSVSDGTIDPKSLTIKEVVDVENTLYEAIESALSAINIDNANIHNIRHIIG